MELKNVVALIFSLCALCMALGLGVAAHGPLPQRPPPVQPDPEIIWIEPSPEPTEFTGWGNYYPTPVPTPTPTPRDYGYGSEWPQPEYEEFDADRARFICHYPRYDVEEGVRSNYTKTIGMPEALNMHLRQHALDYILANGDHDCEQDEPEEDEEDVDEDEDDGVIYRWRF